ncbi:MAG: hypothetical protein ACU85V_04260 [Gammaproteobacteria bacterium]
MATQIPRPGNVPTMLTDVFKHWLLPATHGSRHRDWSKFGRYDEALYRRLTDDLC